jgi:DNA (cytosine-5)-methyltransferase 1
MGCETGTGKKLKTVSLFSGCGGLDLGLRMSGRYDIKLANDVNPIAAETYSQNFGAKIVQGTKITQTDKEHQKTVFLLEDIRKLDFHAFLSLFPETDVVIGGPPCQDFSITRGSDRNSGKITGERGKLYAYFVKALIFLKPKYFVFENVPGIVSDNRGATWDIIREDFQNLSIHVGDIEKMAGDGFKGTNPGYFLAYEGVADASAVGVPQKRKRVLVVGVRKDLIESASADLPGILEEKIREICRSKVEGIGLPFREFPLTAIETFEGNTLNRLEEKYKEIMTIWLSDEKNQRVQPLRQWAQGFSKFLSEGIIRNYCDANGLNFKCERIEEAMRYHEHILTQLGFLGRKVCNGDTCSDRTCDFSKEKDNVISRLYFTPPDENYKFLYRYRKWRVEGKNISMIYRRIHPLKPAYTVTANGGGGTHGYHYERSRSRLTNRERARLQTFPDTFKLNGTYGKQREIIGNAVPPLLGKSVGEAVFEIDRLIRRKMQITHQELITF